MTIETFVGLCIGWSIGCILGPLMFFVFLRFMGNRKDNNDKL